MAVQTGVGVVGVYLKGEPTAFAGRFRKESDFWPEQMEGWSCNVLSWGKLQDKEVDSRGRKSESWFGAC